MYFKTLTDCIKMHARQGNPKSWHGIVCVTVCVCVCVCVRAYVFASLSVHVCMSVRLCVYSLTCTYFFRFSRHEKICGAHNSLFVVDLVHCSVIAVFFAYKKFCVCVCARARVFWMSTFLLNSCMFVFTCVNPSILPFRPREGCVLCVHVVCVCICAHGYAYIWNVWVCI